MKNNENLPSFKEEKRKYSERLDTIGWGLFLVMLGAIFLFPDKIVPEGSFLLGSGIILLGLNLYKYLKGLKPNSFTIFLGIVAFIAGLCNFLGKSVEIFPLILILWGISIILKIFFRKNKE
ncbi:MAG: hypothetical protein K8R49_06330 [Candidatus Cloacimonetes bacterium]|nr:hypothetical protein [Candidatus Cloacimonadota bacterium]